MPFVTSATAQKSYDVIIVGSGAGGGQSAYSLALEGAKVLLIEAGRSYSPEKETPMFQTHADFPLRGMPTPDKPMGYYDATVDGGWEIKGEPYAAAPGQPEYRWWRARMLGGRTNHWGRYAFRNGPYDFRGNSRDGLGFDWPMPYEDVAPWYDKVEMLIGVYGSNEGLENTPDSSPGCLLPAPKARIHELLIKDSARKLGIPVVPAHRAVLSQRLDADRIAVKLHPNNPTAQRLARESMLGRGACFWATPCQRGCAIRANYQSTTVHLPPALASGNLDILPSSMVREVEIGPDGKARGVLYIDKSTGREERVSSRIVILAASAGESVRVLLNSRSNLFPNGLANSSGLVGKYIMDTVGSSLSGQIPRLESLPPHNDEGASGGHLYSPWWLYKEQLAGKLGFARGYHIELGGGRAMPNGGTGAGLEWLTHGTYGRKFKEDARRYYGSFVNFDGRGEMIPNDQCYCEIDPDKKDRWGIPTLRFYWRWSDHETRQAAHMQKTFAEIIREMGGRMHRGPELDGAKIIQAGGSVIHEVGGTMMGSDPKKSVCNQWSQTHDVKNLFVADGGPFASNADKNPTLTIMALAWRMSDHIADEMKRGNL